jgi:hypothetical protein
MSISMMLRNIQMLVLKFSLKHFYYLLLIEFLNYDDMVNYVVIITYIFNLMRKTLFRDSFHPVRPTPDETKVSN